MDYIVLDLEWNQAYLQKALAVQKRINCHLHGEVIQIGAVKLNEAGEICGSYSVIVKPKYFCKLHKHVRDLTGITQEMMDNGTPLPEAAESFRRFCGEDFVFLTWGPDDVPMFRENLVAHKLDDTWLDCDYDLQKIYAREKEGGAAKQRSLEFAMEVFGIEQNLPAHDALNDAYFTALVAQRLDFAGGVANYGQRHEEFLLDETYGDSDIGRRGYPDTETLLASREAAIPPCPLCGGLLKKGARTLHAKGRRYQTLCDCEGCGESLFVTLKVMSNIDETLRFRKTVTKADPAEREVYREKLGREAERRKRPRRRRAKPTGSSEGKPIAEQV